MSSLRALMLVSASANQALRTQVHEGSRPCPEFLRLEQEGVELLDWSCLKHPPKDRSWLGSVRHARAGLRRTPTTDVVFSDGEHVAIPLALGMMARGLRTPHLVLGHRLTTPNKRRFFTTLKCDRAMTRILVHSTHQLYGIQESLGIPRRKLAYVPYYADGEFWRPRQHSEQKNLVVSAGREQRDYTTLARACAGHDISVRIAAGSLHSPHAKHQEPGRWPANVRAAFADYVELRELYAQASVVAIPLVENDFQAGVTTMLEAMAMGKAVVVSATSGQRDVIEDGVTGLTVSPSDSVGLSEAIRFLLANPTERRRLGRNARDAFEARFTLDRYAANLLDHMRQITNENGDEKMTDRLRARPA